MMSWPADGDRWAERQEQEMTELALRGNAYLPAMHVERNAVSPSRSLAAITPSRSFFLQESLLLLDCLLYLTQLLFNVPVQDFGHLPVHTRQKPIL